VELEAESEPDGFVSSACHHEPEIALIEVL
jgi:ribosomal protein S12 methylthiotransferase accessory factor YcaO